MGIKEKTRVGDVISVGEEWMYNHPTVATGLITTATSAVCIVLGVALWKYFRKDVKKMYGEVITENAFRVGAA